MVPFRTQHKLIKLKTQNLISNNPIIKLSILPFNLWFFYNFYTH